jgi:ABC-type branched-subunit amino acid transport system substrate-binding protein
MPVLALADAVNRAGSTDPEKIRDALSKTDLTSNQLMMGYQGVKFDNTGQNYSGRNISDPITWKAIRIGLA